MSILHVTSSISPSGSNSTTLGAELAAKLGGSVTTRDTTTGIPHVDPAWAGANFTPADGRSADQKAKLALSDTLIAELQTADTLIISVPMYNFSVPSNLKAWIDHIARAGITFNYTAEGPKGLLDGKRAYLVITTGGTPVESPVDYTTAYLQQVLNFIGIDDITVIAADRLMVDMDKAMDNARTKIAAL
jgi:FMN-dependent NADH-azoreductase